MSQEQFVYSGTIVVKTGRRAKKDVEALTTRRTRTIAADELYEITPADKEEGSWKKWVRLNELYTIVESDTEDSDGV